MKTNFDGAIGRRLDHRTAARQGRRAGRAGLSVDEAADTAFLVHLRSRLLHQRAELARHLDRQLAEQEALARAADALAQALRATRATLVDRAREQAQARYDQYQQLCTTFGEHWQRRHRDRSWAHIGWRCPRVSDAGEVGGDVDL